MAEVFEATAEGPGGFEKIVALKRMLPFVAQNSELADRFIREARLCARLHHPNIAQVYDFGQHAGDLFIALEYMAGADLGRLLLVAHQRQLRLPFGPIVAIGAGLAAALQYAHEATNTDGSSMGLVHRDVSPSNVLLSYEGAVKLIDFGIAKATEEVTRSSSGALKGKLRYMSPEQVNEEKLDGRSDIFSAGIVLWELVTQQRLFVAENSAGIIRKILSADIPHPSDIRPDCPLELERIILKALAREREDRYQNARDLQRDLETFGREERLDTSTTALGDLVRSMVPEPEGDRATAPQPGTDVVTDESFTSVEIPPEEATKRGNDRRRGSPWLTIIGALGLVGAGAAAVYALNIGRPATEPQPAPPPPAAAPATTAPAAAADSVEEDKSVQPDAPEPADVVVAPDPVEPDPVAPETDVKKTTKKGKRGKRDRRGRKKGKRGSSKKSSSTDDTTTTKTPKKPEKTTTDSTSKTKKPAGKKKGGKEGLDSNELLPWQKK
jgi:serine/threonine-protein kinase